MTTNTTATPDSGATTSTADAADTTTANAKPAEYWQSEAAKAFAARDEAKARLRAIEDAEKAQAKEAAAKQAEAGEYKAAYEKATQQIAEYEKRLGEYAPFFETAQEELSRKRETLDEATAALLEGVPAHKQLALIEKLTATPAPDKPKVPATGAPSPTGARPVYGTKEYLEWSRTAPLEEVIASRNEQVAGRWKG